ncbi:MAG TPA: hypothetical protein VM513_30455 [Kofleriaceae bacterium]|nr:hypothetical protein [Kofleriaceae bacterium]
MRKLVLLAGLSLASCSSTTYVATNPAPRPLAARAPATVTLFTVGLPERPYTEIGDVKATARAMWGSPEPKALRMLRAEAARRGCDGVIVMGPNDKLVIAGYDETHSTGDVIAGSEVRIVRGRRLASYPATGRASFEGRCVVYL